MYERFCLRGRNGCLAYPQRISRACFPTFEKFHTVTTCVHDDSGNKSDRQRHDLRRCFCRIPMATGENFIPQFWLIAGSSAACQSLGKRAGILKIFYKLLWIIHHRRNSRSCARKENTRSHSVWINICIPAGFKARTGLFRKT